VKIEPGAPVILGSSAFGVVLAAGPQWVYVLMQNGMRGYLPTDVVEESAARLAPLEVRADESSL
jgi:hypothetical protein